MGYIFRWDASLPAYMNDVPEVVRAYNPYIIIDGQAEQTLCVELRQTEQTLSLIHI